MANYYLDDNGNITKKKKKKGNSYYMDMEGNITMKEDEIDEELAPVKTTTKTEQRTWFTKGAFEDGYQAGDILKTIGGTVGDLGADILGGALGILEGTIDAGATVVGGVGSIFDKDFGDDVKKFVAKDIINEEKIANTALDPFGLYDLEESSVLGEKADSLVQSGGQLLAQIGLQYVGVPWWVTSGVTSFGSAAEQAFNYDEDTNYGAAIGSSLVSAGAEILTEKLFGGSGLGEKGLINTGALTKGISNKVVKALADFGVDMAAEGTEEIFSQVFGNLGTALYREENLGEILASEEAVDGYIESFIGGSVLGGVMNVRNTGNSIKTGRDYRTGLTTNEQKVVDKEIESRVKEAEKDGNTLSKKDKAKIEEEVRRDLERGYISIGTIEEALGDSVFDSEDNANAGTSLFKQYHDALDSENSIIKEYEELIDIKGTELTERQRLRLEELRDQISDIQKHTKSNELKSKLSQGVSEMSKDGYLAESYNERARRHDAFQADISKVSKRYRNNKNYQATYQKAIDSGLYNNTNRAHEMVETLARISADKGLEIDFSYTKKLQEEGHAFEGQIVDGYFDKSGKIVLNAESPKMWQSLVGHELTHALEKSGHYGELQKAIEQYAKGKGVYDDLRASISKRYKTNDADIINSELTADLVGEYLFKDRAFISNLSAKHRNVFQKVYDEIKHLLKLVTAGSKEARQLEQIKYAFEQAYRDNGTQEGEEKGTQYSLTGKTKDGIEVYETSQEVMNLTWDERKAKYLDLMKNEYRGRTAKFTRNGHTYYATFDNNSVRKPIYGEGRSSKYGVKALIKAGADGDVFDLVENSQYTGSKPNTKDHTTADYFDYFIKTVQIDGRVFDLVADVEKVYGGDGGYVYTLALRDNKKIKASPAHGTPIKGPVYSAGNASGGIITENGINVNDFTENSENNSPDAAAQRKYDPDTKYSISVTDPKTIDFLENQEHITTYKSMQLVDGELHPPMAGKVKGEDGKYHWGNPSKLGVWQQATEDPTNIKKFKKGVGYYTLNKGDGTSVDAAYNPYEHSSNLVLNDQFESAYRRNNLVTVECIIPVSEMSSGYKAEYAKDGTGVMDWKSGVVAGQITDNKRQVYLSRYLKPVRILSEAETAAKYKEVLDGTGVSVPFNVVSPSLLTELEKAGVDIDYEGSPNYRYHQARREAKKAAQYSLSDPQIDNNYLAAVNRGDTETARKMVEDVAREAGYTETVYHGTQNFGFTQIDNNLSDDKISFFAVNSPEVAQTYSGTDGARSIASKGNKAAYDIANNNIEAKTLDLVKSINSLAGYEYFVNENDLFSTISNDINNGNNASEVEYELSENINEVLHDIMSDEGTFDEDGFYSRPEVKEIFDIIKSLNADVETAVSYLQNNSNGNYKFYANTEGFPVIDAKGKGWSNIRGWQSAFYTSVQKTSVEKKGDFYVLIDNATGNEIPDGDIAVNGYTERMKFEGSLHSLMVRKVNDILYIQNEHLSSTREIAKFAKDNGYPGVKIENVWDDGGRGETAQSQPATVYIFFNGQEQVKSADAVTYDDGGNVIPLSERFHKQSSDVRYSLSQDSEGTKLTPEQSEYFKDSKVRDENGSLKVMYHGTKHGGFHEFDSMFSDDNTSFFFVDDDVVAESYSGTSEIYAARRFETAEDFNSFFAEIGANDYEVKYENGWFDLYEDGVSVAQSETAKMLYEEWRDWTGLGEGNVNYAVYLNLTNPLEIDAEGRDWNDLPPVGDAEVYDYIKVVNVGDTSGRVTIEYAMSGDSAPVTETVDLTQKFHQGIADRLSDLAPGEIIYDVPVKPSTTRTYAAYAKANGYDGVIFKNIYDLGLYSSGDEGAHTVAVAFESNQVKSVANEKPTDNPDIRFSLSETVEETKELIALHNVTASKLTQALRLGGLPSPSVAITKKDIAHTNYGDITLLLKKDAIDPQADSRNKVYGSDAWTPTSSNARTEYEVDYDKLREFEKRLEELGKKTVNGYFVNSSLVRRMGVEDVSDYNAAGLAERLSNYDEVRAAYLADIGQTIEPEYKTKVYNKYGNEALQTYIDQVGVQHLASLVAESKLGNYQGIRADEATIRKIIRDKYAEDHASFLNRKPEIRELRLDSFMEHNVSVFTIEDFVRDAWLFYQEGGAVTEEIDSIATSDKIRQAVDDRKVRAWLEPQVAEFLGEPGIRNSLDPFDRYGNSRSFAQTHYEYTAENIVRAMQEASARGEGTFGANANSLIATATPSYSSIDEMHADSGRLNIEDQYDEILNGIDATLRDVEHDIMRTTKHHSDNTYDEEQIIGSIITEAATGERSATAIQRAFANEDYKISAAQANRILALYNEAAQVPTGYFEAKPERVVGFEEVAAFVIPNNSDTKLKQELLNRGYNIAEYDPNVEGDRQKVVNQFEEYMFSLSNVGDTPLNNNGYGTPMRDLMLDRSAFSEDIAPTAAPAAKPGVYQDTDIPIVNAYTLEQEYNSLMEELESIAAQGDEAVNSGDDALEDQLMARYQEVERQAEEVRQRMLIMQADESAEAVASLASLTDADAPVETEVYDDSLPNPLEIDDAALNSITKKWGDRLLLDDTARQGFGKMVQEYSTAENPNFAKLYEDFEKNFSVTTETVPDYDAIEIRKLLRNYPIKVSKQIQKDIADYGAFQRKHFGKLRIKKDANPVDVMYMELSGLYPDLFPADIINPTEQLLRMAEVSDMPKEKDESWKLSDDQISEAVVELANDIAQYKQEEQLKAANEAGTSIFDMLDEIAPVGENVAAEEDVIEQAEVGGIKTVKERLAAKLKALQTELVNNKNLREQSKADFNSEIARLQAEYDAKANKTTKTANNILRRIERLRRMQSTVDAEYAKRISDLDAKVAKTGEDLRTGKSSAEEAAMRREVHTFKMDEIKATFEENGFDFDLVLQKAKDLSTFSTVDNTPQRVMEKSLGYKEGQLLADLTVNKVAQNETEAVKWLNTFTDRKHGILADLSRRYNIKPGSKQSAAAQMYAEGFYVNGKNETVEYGDAELAKDFPDVTVRQNIKALAHDPVIRQIYDETLDKINESRTRNAYPEIQRLDNYYLHFRAMNDTFSRLGIPFNPKDIKAKDLPTDLNGVTADLKPGQPYFSSANHRKGKRTDFDLLGGLEMYLTGAKNQIYHIDDIQTLRALRNYVADTYGQANGLDGLDALTEEEAQERIKDVYKSHLSTFAKFLNEEANIIAGKTALIDRGLEGVIGRRGMTFLDTVNRQVGSNMVGFNISSSLTNFIPVAQTFAKTNKIDFVKAFGQTVANRVGHIFGRGDNFAEVSPVMIRRKGSDRFTRAPWQKVSDAGYTLMSAVDSISTELIARTKYNEFIKKGMTTEQAHQAADKWVSRLMGDRSLGQMPQLYNSKMLGIFTKFQLEVRNQLDAQFYDTIQEAKASNEDIENATQRNAKTAAKVASTFVQLAIVQHLFGKAFESVAGYNPAFDIIEAIIKACGWDDEEESEDTALDNIEQGFLSILEDMPYASTFTGGRIPLESALPISELIKGKDKYGNDKSRWETIKETAPYYFLPGGYGQIKKTTQGLDMFSDDHPIAGSYTDKGDLRFPVEDTLESMFQAGIFGQWANENARDYFDQGRSPLNEKQTQELIDVGLSIQDYWKYRDGLKGLKTVEEKFDYIHSLGLTNEQKNILINNLVDREEEVDISTYGEYANYDEYSFATSYSKKYAFFEQNNISYDDYKASEETREAYTWAYNNQGKYTVSKAITADFMEYYKYKGDLNDIYADKDANGDSIIGSAKTKKVQYINSLNLDYGAKLVLFKSQYPKDDTYNRQIIDYLNSRSDISYEQEIEILQELGFRVTSDGRVTWD